MFLASSWTLGQGKNAKQFINPTGTYKLDSKTVIKDGETYGYFGHVKVKLLDSTRIVVGLFICKGAPNYNSGSFLDTLEYQNNYVIHRTPESDSSCTIKLLFTKQGLTIEQFQKDINFGCEFGHGVFADGFYKLTSKKSPADKEFDEVDSG